MTNTELLREKIEQSGYKLRFIADKIGITVAAGLFCRKIDGLFCRP